MVQQDELELEPSGLSNFGGLGDNLHPSSRRREAGREEFRFSFLLDDTETAGPKGDQPSVVAEGGDANPCCLGRIENRFSRLDLDLHPVDLKSYGLISHAHNVK
jgi:hypothetical protein